MNFNEFVNEVKDNIKLFLTPPVISPLLMIIRIEELWNQVHKKDR